MTPGTFPLLATVALLALGGPSSIVRNDEPETVMVTLHAKTGNEAEAARVLARHWDTARRLNLVRDEPHLTLRKPESGDRVALVAIFAWRDAAIPDNAPDAIRAIWDEMNRIAEPREGRSGVEIAVVQVIK